MIKRERHHGQKLWSERGTRGACQAANATNEKYEKLEEQLGNIIHRQSSTTAMCVGKTVHRT